MIPEVNLNIPTVLLQPLKIVHKPQEMEQEDTFYWYSRYYNITTGSAKICSCDCLGGVNYTYQNKVTPPATPRKTFCEADTIVMASDLSKE